MTRCSRARRVPGAPVEKKRQRSQKIPMATCVSGPQSAMMRSSAEARSSGGGGRQGSGDLWDGLLVRRAHTLP